MSGTLGLLAGRGKRGWIRKQGQARAERVEHAWTPGGKREEGRIRKQGQGRAERVGHAWAPGGNLGTPFPFDFASAMPWGPFLTPYLRVCVLVVVVSHSVPPLIVTPKVKKGGPRSAGKEERRRGGLFRSPFRAGSRDRQGHGHGSASGVCGAALRARPFSRRWRSDTPGQGRLRGAASSPELESASSV